MFGYLPLAKPVDIANRSVQPSQRHPEVLVANDVRYFHPAVLSSAQRYGDVLSAIDAVGDESELVPVLVIGVPRPTLLRDDRVFPRFPAVGIGKVDCEAASLLPIFDVDVHVVFLRRQIQGIPHRRRFVHCEIRGGGILLLRNPLPTTAITAIVIVNLFLLHNAIRNNQTQYQVTSRLRMTTGVGVPPRGGMRIVRSVELPRRPPLSRQGQHPQDGAEDGYLVHGGHPYLEGFLIPSKEHSSRRYRILPRRECCPAATDVIRIEGYDCNGIRFTKEQQSTKQYFKVPTSLVFCAP
mmetsp:Transcript_21505/g.45019  ORF Transcript_21505/g.45019 Transcript_21505/m.45019 type:complete len:295 (+) Transcript_21505:564-1448(+)